MSADKIVESERLPRKAKAQRSVVILVHVTTGFELLRVAVVDLMTLALKVWPVVSANFRAFVPVEPEPFQPVEDSPHRRLGIARFVRVLDPQEEDPPVVTGIEPVEQGGAATPNMEVPSRGRSETDTNLAGTHGAGKTWGDGGGLERVFRRHKPPRRRRRVCETEVRSRGLRGAPCP